MIDISWIMIIILGAMFVFFIIAMVYGIGEDSSSSRWRKELIERGFAQYNSKSGAWEWKSDADNS